MNEQRNRPGPTLNEVYKLAKENNRMLKAMRRNALIGSIIKFVFWIVIVFVIPYFLFVTYLQPILEDVQTAYEDINQKADSASAAAQDLQDLQNRFGDLLDQFTGGQ